MAPTETAKKEQKTIEETMNIDDGDELNGDKKKIEGGGGKKAEIESAKDESMDSIEDDKVIEEQINGREKSGNQSEISLTESFSTVYIW